MDCPETLANVFGAQPVQLYRDGAPSKEENCPAGHATHSPVSPMESLYIPAAQATQSPDIRRYPAAHTLQSLDSWAPGIGEDLPTGHEVQSAMPAFEV